MLAALVAIAQGGGETAGASLLQVSQPALNRHLHQLEQLAEAALFVRSGRGTSLTEAGEALLRHAKLALAEIRIAGEEVASMQGHLNGRLVIGALPLSSGYLIPRAVDQTLRDHPGLNISIIDGTYATLSHGLRGAEVNVIVGALRTDEQEPYALHEALFNDSLSVVARAHHPVLARGSLGGLRDLVAENWVMPLAGTPSRAAFERAFRAEHVAPPNASVEGNSPAILRALLLSSNRLALLSRRQVQQELQQGILEVVPVEVRETERPIGLVVLRDSEPSPAALAFIAALRQAAAQE
jgi:LysR family transcriptional regulator of gallate degradation